MPSAKATAEPPKNHAEYRKPGAGGASGKGREHDGAEDAAELLARHGENDDLENWKEPSSLVSFGSPRRSPGWDAPRPNIDVVYSAANHVGLVSEHFIPATNTQCGNFPQAHPPRRLD